MPCYTPFTVLHSLTMPTPPHQVIIVPGYGLAVAGGQYAVADIAAKLQPYAEAATFCTRGCNPRCQRLQPYAPEAATLGARGCNPMSQVRRGRHHQDAQGGTWRG